MLPHTPDGHGMAADSSHCILACFTVQAKTWPQCWAGAAGCSQQSYCMLFDWGSEGSRLQHPRHTCGCWLNLTDHHLFEQMLTWSYLRSKKRTKVKGIDRCYVLCVCSHDGALELDGWVDWTHAHEKHFSFAFEPWPHRAPVGSGPPIFMLLHQTKNRRFLFSK